MQIQKQYNRDARFLLGQRDFYQLFLLTLSSVILFCFSRGEHLDNSPTAQSLERYMPSMRRQLTFLLLMIIHVRLFGQGSLEKTCLDRIVAHNSAVKFVQFDGEVIQRGDTFNYDFSAIKLSDTSQISTMILKSGLINPRLILSASTDGRYVFSSVDKKVITLLSISNIVELKLESAEPHTKTFSFFIWPQGMLNPSQYLFQLTNNTIKQTADMESFIKGARITAFGFCTILI